jgi:hypothetical protein
MASSPSAAFLRLRAFIAERMRMRPIDQPLRGSLRPWAPQPLPNPDHQQQGVGHGGFGRGVAGLHDVEATGIAPCTTNAWHP